MRRFESSAGKLDRSEKGQPLWLDLAEIASVEVSSEDPDHKFEDALSESVETGWKASAPGPQKITIHFDAPTSVKRIRVEFREADFERAQEISLAVVLEGGSRRELVRQQWMFSPNGSVSECEDYSFDLKDVTAIELGIDPGRHDDQAVATLKLLQVA